MDFEIKARVVGCFKEQIGGQLFDTYSMLDVHGRLVVEAFAFGRLTVHEFLNLSAGLGGHIATKAACLVASFTWGV